MSDSMVNDSKEAKPVRDSSSKSKSEINAEYFRKLEEWLNNYRFSYTCNFFFSAPHFGTGPQWQHLPPSVHNLTNSFVPPIPPLNNQGFGFWGIQSQFQNDQGVEYRIPPIWKRFVAEMIDFFILFTLKLVITFIAVDFFDFVDLDKYNIDFLQQQEKLDYKIAIEMTSEVLFLEMIHRLVVCVYEGLSLHKGTHNQIGGATPGKAVMGIRVVLCNFVQQVENQENIVRVIPATDLGIGWAFGRAFLKNLVLALLFPVCFPLFFSKFNRTGYDILCHSIVVEDRLPAQDR